MRKMNEKWAHLFSSCLNASPIAGGDYHRLILGESVVSIRSAGLDTIRIDIVERPFSRENIQEFILLLQDIEVAMKEREDYRASQSTT